MYTVAFPGKIVHVADFSREINSLVISILVSVFFASFVKEVTRFFGEVVRAWGHLPPIRHVRRGSRSISSSAEVYWCAQCWSLEFDERLKAWNCRRLRRGARRISRLAHATAFNQNVILASQGHRSKRNHQKQVRHVCLRALTVDHVALLRSVTMRSRFYAICIHSQR